MKLTVVTCTGGRPELFALCRRWVERQTMAPTRWLVTTDCGDHPDAPSADIVRIPDDFDVAQVGTPSRATRALVYALRLVEPDSAVVIMEDDDWYGPRYIAELMASPRWMSHQLSMWLYQVPSRQYVNVDYPMPVEGMLGFKAGNVSRVIEWILKKPRPPIDSDPLPMQQLVQIKGAGFGLPGRRGATKKHIPGHHKLKGLHEDLDLSVFRSLLGDDADAYLRLVR